jgi:hypothetical protein
MKYDPVTQDQEVTDSLAPGRYALETPIGHTECLQLNPDIVGARQGVAQPRGVHHRPGDGPVDVESKLRNLGRPLTRADTAAPIRLPVINSTSGQIPMECFFETDHSRLSNPPATLRSRGIDRFETVAHNPQANAIGASSYFLHSSRDIAKRGFRTPIIKPLPN